MFSGVIEIKEAIKFIKKELVDVLGLHYSFVEWGEDEIPPIYWIGAIFESPTNLENGYAEANFLLTAFTREKWLDVIDEAEIIKSHFPSIYGLRADTDSGSIIVSYESATPVPTDEADIKRLQINLKIIQYKKGAD